MVNVAILGFGVVGSGVAEVLTGTGEGIHKKADDLLALKYILDVRQFPDSPFAGCFVQDFSVIENDPEVQVVVETIGGMGAALDFTERALKAGKSVVTSNKELVATHGRRLLALAAEHQAVYLFEASVGGGIPILRPLSECMAANAILEICGILNGTANYIFTRMVQDGIPFAQALKGAQANGYAEQDPSADVEGKDTCRKLCILSSIAFGWQLLPEQVPTTGITQITLEDEAYAAACGRRIKLLGRAIAQADGKVCAYVEPHFVGQQDPLAGVEDVRGREASHRQRGGGRCDCRCPAAGAGQLSSLEPQPAGGRGFPGYLGHPVVCPPGAGDAGRGAADHPRRSRGGERLAYPRHDPARAGAAAGRQSGAGRHPGVGLTVSPPGT